MEPLWAILLDLDETLVRTRAIEAYRKKTYWSSIHRYFDQTELPMHTVAFLERVRPHVALGVVTSSPRSYAERLIAYHQLSLRVLAAYHDTPGRHKPLPDPLLFAANQLEIAPSQCFHIGDHANDVIAAQRANMIPILLSWNGFPEDVQSLPGSTFCANWQEVLSYLKNRVEESRR
jgi:HAD superfamily hydrolase (TIGR01549 family)